MDNVVTVRYRGQEQMAAAATVRALMAEWDQMASAASVQVSMAERELMEVAVTMLASMTDG